VFDPGSVSSVQKCDCSGLLCACPQADGKFSYLHSYAAGQQPIGSQCRHLGRSQAREGYSTGENGRVCPCVYGLVWRGGGDSDNNLVVYWNILISHHCHPLTHGPGVLPLPASNP